MHNQFQKCLKNVTIIPKNKKYLLKVDNPALPKIYGLPKIHKPKLTMRPILILQSTN